MSSPVTMQPAPQHIDHAGLSQRELPRFEHSLSVVSWAYNEEGSIEGFVERMVGFLEEIVEDYELIVVDDGSTDQTPELLAEVAAKYPRVRVITHSHNRGIGEALATTIEAADKEYFMWQMVDWSYDIAHLRQYLELLREYDVVAGVRDIPLLSKGVSGAFRELFSHASRRSDNLWKAIVSLTNYALVRFLFALPMTDYQNVVLYPTALIKSLGMEARSSFANPELLMKAHWRGASIVEVPIEFCPRLVGEAKGTRPQAIVKSILDILSLWYRWVVQQRLPAQGKHGAIRRLRAQEWSSRS